MAAPLNDNGPTNRFLLTLPQPVLQHLWPSLEPVSLAPKQLIYHAEEPVNHLYFVERGLVSLIKVMRDGRSVEIGVVGVEGVTGSGSLFGMNSAYLESVVQIPGSALRISRGVLLAEMAKSKALTEHMQRYAYFSVSAIAQTAACNRLHSLAERCCRWLLIAHDSAFSDEFPITQEFLATMLGVRRTAVSITANSFQKAGLISYKRGLVTIMDRPGLEAAACECYENNCRQFDKLFGSSRQEPAPLKSLPAAQR